MIGHSAAKSGFIPGGDLPALIARLEAAEAGNRDLDAAIWAAVALPSDPYFRKHEGAWQRNVGLPGSAEDWRPLGPYNEPDSYTTSLDAALALAERVLPGWWWTASARNEEDVQDPRPFAAVDNGDTAFRKLRTARAETPALALCIAILRAIQHRHEAEGVVSPNLNPKAQGEVG